jgi:hypothetical protein
MQNLSNMRKVYFGIDVKDMSFEDFSKSHSYIFGENEMKEQYQIATGKDPDAKPKRAVKKQADSEGESV